MGMDSREVVHAFILRATRRFLKRMPMVFRSKPPTKRTGVAFWGLSQTYAAN